MAGLNIVLKLRLHEGNSVPHTRRQLGRMFASLPRDLAGLDFSIAGIDVSANEHSDDGFRPHYQTQLYGFSTKRQWALVDAALRERYRQPGVVHAPVQKKSFDRNPAGFAYAIKGVRGKQTYQANQAA